MTFNWREYYFLALNLVGKACPQNPGSESKCRAAISRAYYSVFHETKKFLEETKSYRAPKQNAHKDLIDTCSQGPERELKEIATKLGRLRNYRTDADYKDNLSNPAAFLDLCMKDTERVQVLLGQLT